MMHLFFFFFFNSLLFEKSESKRNAVENQELSVVFIHTDSKRKRSHPIQTVCFLFEV